MLTYLVVALGGAFGSVGRYAAATAIDGAFPDKFPLGTVLVNISGCFVIGFFAALTIAGGRYHVSPEWRSFFMVGICGGYTTFSSFSLQTLVLLRDGDIGRAMANVVLSVVCCLIAVWIGLLAGDALANRGDAIL